MKKLSRKQKVIIGIAAAFLLFGAVLFSVVQSLNSSKQTLSAPTVADDPLSAQQTPPPAVTDDPLSAPTQDQEPAWAENGSSLSGEDACNMALRELSSTTFSYLDELTILDLTEDQARGTAVAHFAPIIRQHQIEDYGTLVESTAITATYTYSEEDGWRLRSEDLDYVTDEVYNFASTVTVPCTDTTQLTFDLTIVDNEPTIQNIRYADADGSESAFAISNLTCYYSPVFNAIEVTFDYTRDAMPGHENEPFGSATGGSAALHLGIDVWRYSARFDSFRSRDNGGFLDYAVNDLVLSAL